MKCTAYEVTAYRFGNSAPATKLNLASLHITSGLYGKPEGLPHQQLASSSLAAVFQESQLFPSTFLDSVQIPSTPSEGGHLLPSVLHRPTWRRAAAGRSIAARV